MTEGDMDELSQKLAGDDVSAKEMKERLENTEVTKHEEEALVEITELFKEMKSVEGEERRKTSESIVQAAKRWPDKVAKHNDQLVDFVTDDNYYVRKNATFALGLVGNRRHVDFLQNVAEKDEDLEDVARWSAKRIQTAKGEDDDEDEESKGGEEAEAAVESHEITGGGETVNDEDGGTASAADDTDVDDSPDTASTGLQEEEGSPSDDGTAGADDGDGSGSDGASSDEEGTSSGTGGDRRERPSSTAGSTELDGFYREMALTLYEQGEGHMEAVEQAAVRTVNERGSLQPLVEALEGEGDEPLFAARTLSRISEDDPESLRDNVSVLSDLMSRTEDEVSGHLEETLVNVARETPESLVEELSKRD